MLPCIKILVMFLGMNLLIYKKLAKIGGSSEPMATEPPLVTGLHSTVMDCIMAMVFYMTLAIHY